MKKISILLSLIMLMTLFNPFIALSETNPIKVTINGKLVEFNENTGYPFIDENSRTQVPFRAVLETFGAKVSWNQGTQTAKAEKYGRRVEVPIGKSYILVEGRKVENDTVAVIKDGKTYVPIRKVMESFGADVTWDSTTNTVVINKHMSPYNMEMLNELVENTPCDDSILEFRNSKNPRRKGMGKVEGKYFDIYYPKDSDGERVANFLKPYMDTVYMYLTDMYGQQAPVEVHLIHEEDTKDLKEGKIRAEEYVTFVFIEPDNDDGGNNLQEMIHEINHNFFSYVNGDWSWVDDKWSSFVDETLARLIAGFYLNEAYDIEQVDFYNIESDFMNTAFEVRSNIGDKFLTLDEVVDILSEDGWGKGTPGKDRASQRMALSFWIYVYNEYGIEKIQEVLRTIGEGDYKSKLERMLGKSMDELSNDLINEMKKVYNTFAY